VSVSNAGPETRLVKTRSVLQVTSLFPPSGAQEEKDHSEHRRVESHVSKY
jgi:hypothetical protein